MNVNGRTMQKHTIIQENGGPQKQIISREFYTLRQSSTVLTAFSVPNKLVLFSNTNLDGIKKHSTVGTGNWLRFHTVLDIKDALYGTFE